ncbi:MAG: monoheme cytochrome C [Aureispira sp.]|nr:monoheme cytochrome C [Aureispira sp.]
MKNQPTYKEWRRRFDGLFIGLIAIFTLLFLYGGGFLPKIQFSSPKPTEKTTVEHTAEDELNKIENGIHLRSGLIADEGYKLIIQNCGNCHSLKLVTQNRASKEGWIETIEWMQETQKLGDLGENREAIVNYLAKNYGIKKSGRRPNLKNTDWYELPPAE